MEQWNLPDPLKRRLDRYVETKDWKHLTSDEARFEIIHALAEFETHPDLEELVGVLDFLTLRPAFTMTTEQGRAEMVLGRRVQDHLQEMFSVSADSPVGRKLIVQLPVLVEATATGLRRLAYLDSAPSAKRKGRGSSMAVEEKTMSRGRTPIVEDLTDVIAVLRAADPDWSPAAPIGSEAECQMGIALWTRFNQTGAHEDILAAIGHLVTGLALARGDEPEYAKYLANLGTAIFTWAERVALPKKLVQGANFSGAFPQDQVLRGLGAAIDLLRGAARRATDEHAWALCQSNLGLALQIRHSMTEDPDDIDEAVDVLRMAVAATPPTDPSGAGRMTNLCMVLQRRFSSAGDPADLSEAIPVGKEAIETLPAGSPVRARVLANVGECLESWFALHHKDRDRRKALRYFREAAHVEQASPWDRIRPARGWGRLAAARHDWAEATTAYRYAIELLPLLASGALSEVDRLGYLGAAGLSGLASEAAACALRSGRPQTAVELLEEGRGLIIAQTLGLRADLSEGDHPLRFAQLEEIAGQVGETIVWVNVGDSYSDAFLLTPFGLTTVALPGINREQATANSVAFLSAIDELISAEEAGDHLKQVESRLQMTDILAWLWKVVASPVLDSLTSTGGLEPPHVCWIPTGALSFLPIHAAGVDGHSVMDSVISSYAPTARAVAHRSRRALGKSAFLLVAPEDSQGEVGAGFEEEVNYLRMNFSPHLVIGEDATSDTVLSALGEAEIAHFACDGYQVPANPIEGGLKLRDGILHVLEIVRSEPTDGSLAYLSACETAVGGHNVEDESIHLAAAFSVAGFDHVIGTLWRVNSVIAAQIAIDFYTRIAATDGSIAVGESADALHAAILKIRESHPDKPDLWASHIHIGAVDG